MMSRNCFCKQILPLSWYVGPYEFRISSAPTRTKPEFKPERNVKNQGELYDSWLKNKNPHQQKVLGSMINSELLLRDCHS